MPKVTQEHRIARKREISLAALRLFARQGFQATSMADIIVESGLSAGAIYGYYRGKDEIINTAISELLDLEALTAEEAEGQPVPPGEMMRRYVCAIESEMGQLSLLVQVWGQAVLDPTARHATDRIGDQLRSIHARYLARWYRHDLGLDLEASEEAARRFAPVHVGLMQGCILQSAIFTEFDRDAYFAAVDELQPRRSEVTPS
jgi:AcrR family transcriptional regulator